MPRHYMTRDMRPAAPPMNGEFLGLRTHARRHYELDLWRQHGGPADPRLQGRAFALVDRQGVVVHVADDLAALRAWLLQRRGDR